MPKISGRLLTTIVVTILSIVFVFPTLRYFVFVNGLPATPTAEQERDKRDLLEHSRMIKLGLDLQGGADFLLAVDTSSQLQQNLDATADRIKTLFANDKVKATVKADSARKAVTVKLLDAKDANVAKETLAKFGDTFDAVGLDKIASAEVTLKPKDAARAHDAAQAVDAALETIKRRIDNSGLVQPIVAKQGSDRIRVQVPGEVDPKRVRETLLKTAYMEFRLLPADHAAKIVPFIKENSMGVGGTGVIKDELLEDVKIEGSEKTVKRLKKDIQGVPEGYMLALGEDKRMDKKNKTYTTTKNLVYLVKDGRANVTGKTLRRAYATTDPGSFENPINVSLEFNPEGARDFGETTKDHVGERFAILIDGEVISAPTIQSPIMNGMGRITGSYTMPEAQDFALVLRSGSLPAPLRVIEENTVGASLGNDSIVKSGQSVLIGAVLLTIMMVAVYSAAGLIAVLAMLLNVLLIMAILALARATLTLSGIGGILLTMGMAVDANVLIYERLREELASGKPLRAAMNAAFSRAFTVIFDSHVTALLPALVLILFEIVSGSVRGFWTALAMGLIANLYTGLTVTRALLEFKVEKTKKLLLGTWRPFLHANVDWMRLRGMGLVFSGGLAVLSIGYIAVKGINPGIDFTGGVLATADIPSTKIESVRNAFHGAFKEVRVQDIIGTSQFQITVPIEKAEKAGGAVDSGKQLEEVKATVAKTLEKAFPGKAKILSQQTVESVVGGEFQLNALLMMAVASIVILAYLAMRFRAIYGLGAVLALVHDVLITLGVFLLLGKSVTLDIVSALMIILGYSVSDTIVVFDRVRETMADSYGKSLKDIFNSSINRTLSRTILSSGTTILASLVLFLFGGAALRDFALVLTLGFTFGTYSSIFVASALVYQFLIKHKDTPGASPAASPARPRVVVQAGA